MDTMLLGDTVPISPDVDTATRDAVQSGARAGRKARSTAALHAFFGLASSWQLSTREQMTLLGLTARSTFFQWKKQPDVVLPKDTLERIGYLCGIGEALGTLVPEGVAACAWLRQSDQTPLFAGAPPLERMLLGRVADLLEVHRCLDGRAMAMRSAAATPSPPAPADRDPFG